MKRVHQVVTMAMAIVAMLAATLIRKEARAQAQRPSTPVSITDPIPLPVTGAVGITGTPSFNIANAPTVHAVQSGTWNVGIAGTPTVSVSNTANGALFVRNLYEPGRNLYQHTVSFNNTPADNCNTAAGCIVGFGQVPSGKRLVLKNITGAVFLTTPGVLVPPELCVGGSYPGCALLLRIPTVLQSGIVSGQNMIGINTVLDDYIDENNALFFRILPVGGTVSSTSSVITLSGFLVDK